MLSEKLLAELQEYVESHLVNVRFFFVTEFMSSPNTQELEEFINKNRQPTFSQVLFRLIDEKGAKDSEIYKKAGIDRRHFSKIRSNHDYRPGRNTVITLAFALELSQNETARLLSSAGYSLSDSDTSDLIIQFFLKKKIFDIDDVNQALVFFSLKPLMGILE